jgi:hypothetical protein
MTSDEQTSSRLIAGYERYPARQNRWAHYRCDDHPRHNVPPSGTNTGWNDAKTAAGMG